MNFRMRKYEHLLKGFVKVMNTGRIRRIDRAQRVKKMLQLENVREGDQEDIDKLSAKIV